MASVTESAGGQVPRRLRLNDVAFCHSAAVMLSFIVITHYLHSQTATRWLARRPLVHTAHTQLHRETARVQASEA